MMTPLFSEPELRNLFQQDEGQFLEFKSLWDLSGDTRKVLDRRIVRDFIAECVAAFANADGGTLLLGVDDDGTPSDHGYPEEAIVEFLAVPERRLRPAVPIRHQRCRIDGNEVIIIQVRMEPEAVMVDGDGFPYRVGDRTLLEPQEVINQRKQAYRTVGYEQRIRPEVTLDDVDLELAKAFLSKTVYQDRSIEDVLGQLGLVVPKAGGLAITNAALLLFGKPPFSRWHPRAGIRMFRVAGTEREHGKRRNVTQLDRVELPLATAIPAAHQAAARQIRKAEKLHDLFFREMPEYPEFAWQEAIINAFAHRDYNDQGREIEVWFFEDRMEVMSPGELVAPVTLDQLRQRRSSHASRNPLLVRVLVEVAIMREEGEGIPRMYDEMEESLLKQPQFAIDDSQFCVTLLNEPIFTGPSVEWQGIVSQLALSTAQQRVLLACPDRFSNEDYRSLNGVDRDQAYREIQQMIALGVVLPPKTAGRGTVYRPTPNLLQTRAWLEKRVPMLQEFFQAHNRLTNGDYREMFDVTRYAAVRDLRRLTEEKFLTLEGERRGACYRPGPALSGEPKL